MAERIISQQVVGRRVIGSSNPIARKFRDFKSSCAGITMAPILFLIAIGLIFYSEKMDKDSEVVEKLNLETATEAYGSSGMKKITGDVTITSSVTDENVGEVLYYSSTKEEYQQVEKTETKTRMVTENGEDIEETYEETSLVDEWVDLESKSAWAEFKLGEILVDPKNADLKLDTSSKEYWKTGTDLFTGGEVYEALSSGTTKTPAIGDKRIVVEYLPVDTTLLVVGELANNKINGGEVFIVTTKTDSALLTDLRASETAAYWGMKFLSWLLLTFGFLGLLGPILSLLDFIPFAGKAAGCVAFVVGGAISFVIVLAGTLIVKFWYLCIAGAVVVVIGGVVLVVMLIAKKASKNDKKDEPTEKQVTEAKE